MFRAASMTHDATAGLSFPFGSARRVSATRSGAGAATRSRYCPPATPQCPAPIGLDESRRRGFEHARARERFEPSGMGEVRKEMASLLRTEQQAARTFDMLRVCILDRGELVQFRVSIEVGTNEAVKELAEVEIR